MGLNGKIPVPRQLTLEYEEVLVYSLRRRLRATFSTLHIMELIFAAAFKACMGVSSGSNTFLSKRFKVDWERIAKTTNDSGFTKNVLCPRILAKSKLILTFATASLHLINHETTTGSYQISQSFNWS